MLKFGVIGYGNRIGGIVDKLIKSGEATLTAVMDPELERVKAKAMEKGYEGITFYTDAEEMLEKEQLDGVLIGTRCNLHTHYAMLVAKHNIPLFLESPSAPPRRTLLALNPLYPR